MLGDIMYAIIKTGGKQYRVEKGDTITIDSLSKEQGEEIIFEDILLVKDGEKATLGSSHLSTCSVKGVHRGVSKGKKLIGFKYKRRSLSQRKRFGHRQKYSLVEITEISQK